MFKAQKFGMIVASVLGTLAVSLGAFGSHALQLEPPQITWFETGNRYHFYHALAVMALVFLPLPERTKYWVSSLWLAGVIGFSGSLYLAAADVVRWFWLTPVGGVLLLAGWLVLLINSCFNTSSHSS